MIGRGLFQREERTKEKVFLLEFGFRKVRLPGRPEDLYLVVVKVFGEKPLMLLTNVKIMGSRRDLTARLDETSVEIGQTCVWHPGVSLLCPG